ncbi:hypothetical protein ACVWWR_008097 [Bradyrhizobium sp. LM3.2]
MVGNQDPSRRRQHQGHCDIGDRGRIGAGAVADRNVARGGGLQIDAVIAGAVADDGAELWKQVHRLHAERRAARGEHRADATELVGRKHLARGLAAGVEQLEPLGEARHHRFGKARVDQDLVSHCSCFQ